MQEEFEEEVIEEQIEINVPEDQESKRLDIFIESQVESLSRSRIKKLIEDNFVLLNNKVAKASLKVKSGDFISIKIPELKEISAKPENIPINIVYEDDDLAVINKSKGMATHPAPGSLDGTLVNALMYHLKNLSGIGGSLRPGIVHRLDKDTSGLLVIAKNDMAHQSLSSQIQSKEAKRFYKAVVIGNFKEDEGIIDLPIDRNPKDRKKMAIVIGGRESITHWKVLERFGNYTLLELELKTGRTHQIRVHLSHLKHGIIGDDVYGPDIKVSVKLNGQALHAYKLCLTHPRTKEPMEFIADEPEEFKKLVDYFRKINNSN